MQATVTVKYVNPPKEGKKMGSINTEEMGYFGVWADKLSQFSQGGKYTIEYSVSGDFKRFEKMLPNQGPMEKPAQERGGLPDTLLSNCLANAISAGMIQAPSDLSIWATALKNAHKTYHGPDVHEKQNAGGIPEDFDDWVPFAPLRDLP